MKRSFARFLTIAAASVVTASSAWAQAPAPATSPCQSCGVVQSVNSYQQQEKTSGVGLVAGGVVGGVVGHQIGSGRGNTVATIAGAGLGALAGNEIEKNRKTKTMWSVSIRMDTGNVRTFNYSNPPSVASGDRVKLVDGGKRLALLAP